MQNSPQAEVPGATATKSLIPKKPQEDNSGDNIQPEQPEPKPVGFSIPKIELVTMVRTPESQSETITLSDKSIKTLVDTAYYHLDIIENMAQTDKPPETSLPGDFYRTFKLKFSDRDLSDESVLKQCVEQFINEGKGVNVRAALKLAEWEAATLQAATGRKFEKSGKPEKGKREVQGKQKIRIGSQGLTVSEEGQGFFARHFPGKEIVGQDFELTNGDSMTIDSATNALLTDTQEKFLKAVGWVNGNLSRSQLAILDNRLIAITAFRTELYIQTGLKAQDIELNFIKADTTPGNFAGRKYVDGRIAHFIGDVGVGTNVREILEADAIAITKEIKDKVKNDLDKLKKEAQERKVSEGTIRQLTAKISEIEENTILSEEEKQAKTAEFNAEIARLQSEYVLFTRQKLLPGEIAQAQKTRDEAQQALISYQGTLTPPSGETTVDLLKWSSGPGEPESWQAIKTQHEERLVQKSEIEAQITDLKEELNAHRTAKPSEELKVVTQRDRQGNTVRIEPDDIDKHIKEEWQTRLEQLQHNIDILRDSIYKVPMEGTITLSQEINELKAKYTRRKEIVEAEQASQLITSLRSSERAVTEKDQEKTDVDGKIASLPVGEQLETELKQKLKDQRDKLKAVTEGGITGADKTEIEALHTHEKVFDSTEIQNRENRIKEAEQGLLDTIEYSPRWKKVPDVIKRCVQLIWGEEILQAYPSDKELAERVFTLINSKKYLDIFIKNIDKASGDTLGYDHSANIIDGKYSNLTEVFPDSPPSGKTKFIEANINLITRDLLNKIIEEMRKEALGLTSTKNP